MDRSLDQLAATTAIGADRLRALEAGDTRPRMIEIAMLADALQVDPIHLFRPSPAVLARRSGAELGNLTPYLAEIDAYFATYEDEVRPEIDFTAPATSERAARATGEGYARRNDLRDYSIDADPLIDHIERALSIPVFIWPIPDAPVGATIDFNGTLGILINSWDRLESNQRFTLAHELGHILIRHITDHGGDVLVDTRDDVERPSSIRERMADACSSGLLADHQSIAAHWGGDATPEEAAKISVSFGMSYTATINALRRYRFIRQEDWNRLDQVSRQEAYLAAGATDIYQTWLDRRNRKRIPPYFEETEALLLRLEELGNR